MRAQRLSQSIGSALIAALAVWAISTGAEAQRLGGQRFAPAGSEDGIFETEGADRRRVLWPYVALHTHYAWNPVVIVDDGGQQVAAPVEHLLAADLVASLAVWEGLEFGFLLPVTLFSEGDVVGGIPPAPGTALGDFQLRVAYRIRLAEHTALAFHVPVLFPTNADDNMLALGWGARPTVAFMQRVGPVEILVNAFVLVRESPQVLVDYRGGHETGARLGFRFDLSGRWQTALLLEGSFATAFEGFFAPATTPAEARIGLEHWFNENWRLSFFGGSGIGPGVGAPDFRGGAAIAFGNNVPYRPVPSETDGDRDGDGIADGRDRCPNRAEDRDGYADRDGCPENDNDRDGLLDHEDHCPNEPETRDGVTDDDGCPDRIRVVGTRITTFEVVHFRTGSDEILERSHPMLSEVGGVLHANPEMRIRVEGHTDNEGDARGNMVLSRQRAASVRRFLIEHGASPRQVRSRGYGETRPIASNRTPRGRFRNRRVEFHIVH